MDPEERQELEDALAKAKKVVDKITFRLQAPERQKRATEQEEQLATLKARRDQIRKLGSSNDGNVAELLAVNREIAKLEPPLEKVEDEEDEGAPAVLCAIDAVELKAGTCPVCGRSAARVGRTLPNHSQNRLMKHLARGHGLQ
jgi:DNA repair exonuclease SbcCD ATPase subunit